MSTGDTSFSSPIRLSLLQRLDANRRVASTASLVLGLQQTLGALRADALDDALRTLDRTWRCHADHAAVLAPLYGSLLVLEARDYNAALGLLQRALGFAPDPDVAALIAVTLLRLQRFEEARGLLETALGEYCALPDSLLGRVAGELMQHPAIASPGWIARGPDLEFVGELSSAETANVLDITLDGKAAFTQLLRSAGNSGRRSFCFQAPQLRLMSGLQISARGVPLLGTLARLAPDFGLDGRVQYSGALLSGWARLAWLPGLPPRLRVADEHGHTQMLRSARMARALWHWPFQLNLRAAGFRGSRITVSAQLADGRWQPLPESPLLLNPALRLSGQRPARLVKWRATTSPRLARMQSQNERPTDVIIPVYRGREETLACIDAVLATIDNTARVVVVDDATDEAGLAAALDALAQNGRITLLRNAQNLGFVASVNRALALHATHDVVLLNSDTLVFDDWLARLRAAAYSGPAVGTVTPLSNSGTIASYPRPLGAAMDPEDGAALHALAASTLSGRRAEIPVGVGFCLYIRRDCLREVGSLDADLFGKGYGEETDFCLRARQRGWSHQLAADVFVYHAGGVSFGTRRAALLDRSQRLVNLRHPGYDRFIASFVAQDPLHVLRRELDERRMLGFDGQFVLLVTLALTGGVDRFVAERCRALRAEGLFPLVLRAATAGDARRCELWTDAMEVPNLRYDVPGDLSRFKALLTALPLAAVEIQHFLHLDARLIELVRGLPIPYDVVVHDYAWICPRITLIDGSGRYCGEPAVEVCRTCVRRNGSSLGESISVAALRARSARWLREARRVIAPSSDTAQRLQRHFQGLQVEVRPHATPTAPAAAPLGPATNKRVRVALIGAIGEHKGYRALLACARDARSRRLPLEFVVIGYTQDDAPLLATGKVFITGRYTESEAPHLLRREQPHIAWLPSVWPETWCYTLDYALEAGLPVAAFDLGSVAERVRAAGNGVLLPMDLPARQVNDRLLRLARRQRLRGSTSSRSVQTPLPPRPDDVNMHATQDGEKRMIKTSTGKSAPEVTKDADEGLSASVQVLPLPAGLYLFSVKTAGPVPARTSGEQLSLPAVHVGLGPGVRSEQVEFMAGPSTHGAWLFTQGDLLVTRINGTGATLIMTSMRAPGGEVLSIKVERLEARTDAAPAQPAPNLARPVSAPAPASALPLPLPLQIGAHIRTRGDMSFADVAWAGRVAPGLWIESFSVRPLQLFTAKDLEYKGLTGSGFETPWLSDDKMCGTKGMAVPLVGFAVRLKPSPATAAYDCEYSGYFQSGVTVGPLRNGAPCRSTVANDPLEGIQIRLVKRVTSSAPVPRRGARAPASSKSTPAAVKASTSQHPGNGIRKTSPVASANPGKPRVAVARSPSRSAHPVRKHSTRRP